MKKKDLVESILELSKIHHNIRINFSKLPDCTEEDEYDWQQDAEIVMDTFIEDVFMYDKRNDSGNRNLCGCKNIPCEKHDFWHFYTYGRMGATFYWDKYWDSTNSGLSFKYEEYLEEMQVPELKDLLSDIKWFNKSVTDMMDSFYEQCKLSLGSQREQKADEEKEEKLYQKTLAIVKKHDYIKRLVNDLI